MVLVPAFKEREALVGTPPEQGWAFLLLATQTWVPFGASPVALAPALSDAVNLELLDLEHPELAVDGVRWH